ncbi:hypothetical protein FRC07_013796 [Ceratobasidium sp. 392]|nr:hypothetical protein FRC07_013796 [Ceratobasidium sp. 392]
MPSGYSLLPTAPGGYDYISNPKWQKRLRPRHVFTLLSTIGLFLTFGSFFYWGDLQRFAYPERSAWTSDATDFDEVFMREAQLPQHNLTAPYPEGQNGRFIRFSNQVWGLGWNNLLQERLLNTILAYESNRAPVFSPFEAWWGSTFTGWNQLPQLPDKFDAPPRGNLEGGKNTPEIADYYLKRCLPTPSQVASRLHSIRAQRRTHLSHIFIATNAEPEYLAELRVVLAADGRASDAIVTSDELELNWQAASVSVAVDMAIMSRAEIFIGNGFSSLSSNVIVKRMTSGMPLDTTRLW